MRIMTIHAAHLSLADRVVIRKIGFGILFLVASQAVRAHLPPRLNHSRNARGLALESGPRLPMTLAMNAVAFNALEVLGLVCTGKPVPHMIGFRMAA